MPTSKRKFTVILEPEDDKGYSVHCPALPGCVSQGNNRREALKNIKEAIQLVLETLEKELVTEQVLEQLGGQKAPPYKDSPDLIAEEIRQILKARDEDGLSFGGITLEEVELSVRVPA